MKKFFSKLQIANLQKLGEKDGFKLMVLGVPYKHGNPGVYKWLEKRSMWLFDASDEPVWSTNKMSLFFKNDYHFTPEGNKVLAQRLHEILQIEKF